MPSKSISIDEVQRLQQSGQTIDLLDVRTAPEYDQLHAKGAQHTPLDRVDPAAIMAARNGSPSRPLYVLCRSGSRADKAVEKFQQAGFTDVYSVEGGTVAWEKAGLPVVRGEGRVISLERQVRIGAGVLVLVGVVLGWLVHPAFYGISAFVGAGLIFAGVTDWCGMGMLLAKLPWNRGGNCDAGTCSR